MKKIFVLVLGLFLACSSDDAVGTVVEEVCTTCIGTNTQVTSNCITENLSIGTNYQDPFYGEGPLYDSSRSWLWDSSGESLKIFYSEALTEESTIFRVYEFTLSLSNCLVPNRYFSFKQNLLGETTSNTDFIEDTFSVKVDRFYIDQVLIVRVKNDMDTSITKNIFLPLKEETKQILPYE